MEIKVNMLGLPFSESVSTKCRMVLEESLERFAERIQSVKVIVEDVNGPRGGYDKRCRCLVKLDHLPAIVIRDQDKEFNSLFHRVANRLAFALSHQLERRFKRARQRPAARGALDNFSAP